MNRCRQYGGELRILLAIAFAAQIGSAQEILRPGESLSAITDSLQRQARATILFERNQNTFNWSGGALVDTSLAGIRTRFRQNYTSNIILLDRSASMPERRLESNQHTFSLLTSHPVTPAIHGIAGFSSLVYSDKKAVGLSTASQHSLVGGFETMPVPVLSLSPLIGYRWDNQGEFNDRGMHYILSTTTRNLAPDGYSISGEGQFHRDELSPRTLEGHFARVGVQKSFEGRTRDSLQLGIQRNRREFYSLRDVAGTIEGRVEDILSFANLLDYQLDNGFLASLFVAVSNRTLEKSDRTIAGGTLPTGSFPSTIEEFRLDAHVQTSYEAPSRATSAFARVSYSERNENHAVNPVINLPPDQQLRFSERSAQEQTKNNIARRTALSGLIQHAPGGSDTLGLTGTVSILRYDTPSTLNNEDRDELLSTLSLFSFHRLTRTLHLGLTLDGSLTHVVYIHGERSANNNYNRTLRLSPRLTFRPFTTFSSVNTFEVLANYTVYDFEEQAVQIRSFSYRQFSWADSTTLDLNKRLSLDFLLYFKLYERGQLKWSDFRERTENSFRDESYTIQFRATPEPSLMFTLGLRIFMQTRFSFSSGEKQRDAVIRSFGPTCAVLWQAGRVGDVGIRGWYESRSQTGGITRAIANMSLNINFLL